MGERTVKTENSVITTSDAPVEAATLTYNNIRVNASNDLGQFRTINDKFGWRARKAFDSTSGALRKTFQIDSKNVKSTSWSCSRGHEYQLQVIMKNEDVYRFDGFKETDYSTLENHLKLYWKVTLEHKKVATEGWNWGVVEISEKKFELLVKDKTAFNLSSEQVNQVSITKSDVSVILNPDSQKAEVEDQLLEMRFYMTASKNNEDKKVESLKQALICFPTAKTGVSLQAICTFFDVKLLVPLGRFNLEIFKQSLKLIGKSNDFIIDFKSVTQIFLLPSFSSPHVNIVLSLSTPIRKGHTSYHNIIIQFEAKKCITLELVIDLKDVSFKESLSDLAKPAEVEFEGKNVDYETVGQKEISLDGVKMDATKQALPAKNDFRFALNGEEHYIAARIFKELTNQPLTQPGTFRSSSNQCCFRVSYKADSGSFYPLSSSFIFLPKPVIIVNYSAIKNIILGRTLGSQLKLFEFNVVLKTGQTLSFSSVDRQELTPLTEFLKTRNVVFQLFDEKSDLAKNSALGEISEDDSEDEDFEEDKSFVDDDDEESSESEEEKF